ncbi:hypothetical protein D8S78_02550 [Natrialba swarupiae]|nr:hypothetical protein [Natrialba swarupiae]
MTVCRCLSSRVPTAVVLAEIGVGDATTGDGAYNHPLRRLRVYGSEFGRIDDRDEAENGPGKRRFRRKTPARPVDALGRRQRG